MNYNRTKFFNTGYLPNNSNEKRFKQGLDSQFISNTCVNYMIETNQQNLPYFNTYYYPHGATPLPTYGLPPISNMEPCVRWLNLYN